jgi:hypothetical protein
MGEIEAHRAGVIRVQNGATTTVCALLAAVVIWGTIAGQTAGEHVVLGVAAVMLAALTIRSCRCSIVLDDAGLVSRNEHSTVRLRWQDIEGFKLRSMQGIGALRRRDGRFIRLQSYPVWRRSDSDALVARLERERQARTSNTPH